MMMKPLILFFLANAVMSSTVPDNIPQSFKDLLILKESNPELLAKYIAESPLAVIQKDFVVDDGEPVSDVVSGALPIVVAHGMGDSCFNSGMKSITKAAGSRVGTYSVCIPTGDGWLSDTINGFLLSMDDSVEVFAKKVRADPKLANGFNAFGLSQGNNVIRGYITKYNDPPVHTFMSICGINAGVGAFPNCAPNGGAVMGKLCTALSEVLGDFAYLEFIQNHLFQADYFRDPAKVTSAGYLAHSQLARWNGESGVNATFVANYAKTSQFVWVKGLNDTVVWPRDGEWWGQASPSDPWHSVLPMKQSSWYVHDTFGLRSADEAGKNHFESFQGEHIQFTQQELYAWLDKYFK